MKLFFIVLFCAIALFAQDDICQKFCLKCQDDSSEVCLDVKQSCECSTPNETSATISVPLSKVDFGEFGFNSNQKFEPLTKVDFGGKGDDTHTAVRQEDGSYEIQNKERTWIIVGSIVLTILTAIILGNAL